MANWGDDCKMEPSLNLHPKIWKNWDVSEQCQMHWFWTQRKWEVNTKAAACLIQLKLGFLLFSNFFSGRWDHLNWEVTSSRVWVTGQSASSNDNSPILKWHSWVAHPISSLEGTSFFLFYIQIYFFSYHKIMWIFQYAIFSRQSAISGQQYSVGINSLLCTICLSRTPS